MAVEYLEEYTRLRDEFRLRQNGGCANVDAKLNMDAFNGSWPTPGSGEDDFACDPVNKSSSNSSASPPDDNELKLTAFNGDIQPQIIADAFASENFIQEPDLPLTPKNTTVTEIYPEHRPRKGHKKSRGGCYNCKRRKIKCQENQPACKNCMKKKVRCEYPAPKTLSALRTSFLYSPSPVTSVNLQSTPMIFTLTDMRLFHHYLQDAYPHLPVGNEEAWLNQIPLIAHHNEYLMHAILAVAASHLELITGDDFSSIALHHRVRAIQGSSEALTKKNRTGSDGDALLASCYLLTFNSSYMKDGIPEFFQFVRGCSLVSDQLRAEKLPMAFFLTAQDHFEFMKGRLMNLPVIDGELLYGADESLSHLPPLFELEIHEIFYQKLVTCVAAIRRSSLQGYFTFIAIYQTINLFTPRQFADFSDPHNDISRILVAHFFAIQLMILPILDREWAGRTKITPCRMNLDWVARINAGVKKELRGYLDWPTAVADAVLDELVDGDLGSVKLKKLNVLRKRDGCCGRFVLGWDLKGKGVSQ